MRGGGGRTLEPGLGRGGCGAPSFGAAPSRLPACFRLVVLLPVRQADVPRLTPARETFWAGPGPDAFSWGRRGAWRRRAVPAAVCRGGAGGPHSACGSPRPAREPPRARGRGEGAPRGVGAEMRARPV